MKTRILSEMTASIWKVLVSEGDSVTHGDDLLILESMKMEIPVTASICGEISRILVVEGQSVQEGALLLEIDEG